MNTMSHLELTFMLDSLWFTYWLCRVVQTQPFSLVSTKARHDNISVDQAIQSVEAELGRPESEKKRLGDDDGLPESSVSAIPVLSITGHRGQELQQV